LQIALFVGVFLGSGLLMGASSTTAVAEESACYTWCDDSPPPGVCKVNQNATFCASVGGQPPCTGDCPCNGGCS